MKALMVVAFLTLASASAAEAQEMGAAQFTATTLNLSATGEVRAPPDLAVLSLGVQADAPTAAAAFSQARAQMNAIVATLRSRGVSAADVQTTELDLQAQYEGGDGDKPRRLTGYQATNTVTARLHDLGRVGAVVDALVSAGANRINGISFQLDDPTAVEDEARRRAVMALQAKAALYAQAMGYRLQRLVSLSDGSSGYSGPPRPVFAMRSLARPSTPVAAGELTVSASLSATYELER